MNKISHIFSAFAVVGCSLVSSCNSTETIETEPIDYSAVAVKGFSLKADKSVLNNLDSVFFSINLNTAEIYNADSLPFGTKITALGVNITSSSCKEATLYVSQGEGRDERSYDYLSDPDAEIDFSQGPVRFHIVSADGQNSRDYSIKVNVHKMVPDSLYWAEIDRADLPSTFTSIKEQKTVSFKESAYCLTTDGSSYSLAVSSDPFMNVWTKKGVNLGADVDVRTFTATDDALYILTTDGKLLTGTDGASWSATSEVWSNILCGYEGKLLGIKEVNGTLCHVEYPGAAGTAIPEGFPVSGASGATVFNTKWSESLQIIIAGGRKADGALCGNTWMYDGNKWGLLSSGLPAAEGYSIVNYTVCETDTTTWRIKETAVTLAMGGLTDKGVDEKVYLSRDMGVTWKTGDDFVQLPKYLTAGAYADLLVFNRMLTINDEGIVVPKSARGWQSMPLVLMPRIVMPEPRSRAIAPITEWECPYIYMFGGVNGAGSLYPTIWRGVVNHYSFIPLQ